MFKLMSKNDEIITPELAEDYLKYNTFMSQRPLSERHVRNLKRKMMEGLFISAVIGFAVDKYGNKFLVNGQHTLEACIQSGLPMSATVQYHSVENEADKSLLFQQYDTIKVKTLLEMVSVEADALGLTWPRKIPNLVVSAFSMDNNGTTLFHIPNYDRVKFLKPHIPEGSFLNSLIVENSHNRMRTSARHLLRASVARLIMLTWLKDKTDATFFWTKVRDGELLTKHMAAYHYRNFLLNVTVAGGTESRRGGKDLVRNHEILYRGALCWNSFRNGNAMTRLPYYPERNVPDLA